MRSTSCSSSCLTAIGVGIDTARYGHRVSFLRPDRQPAAKALTVLENRDGYIALQQRLEQLHVFGYNNLCPHARAEGETMPMHDWTRVKAGTYHNFHYGWVAAIRDRLNAGLLPPGFFAMAEQIIGRPETDVVALQTDGHLKSPAHGNGGVAVAPPRPKTRFVVPLARDEERYARMANRVAIHHELGEVVAVIEVVSPGNKDRKRALQSFVDKAIDLIGQEVNLLLVDPFPPGRHDPQGIHGAIWTELTDEPFELPADQPLTLAAYQVEPVKTCYVEPIAVGDRLPNMPVFLDGDFYIEAPLEETYQTTWNALPVEIRRLLEPRM